MDLRKLKSGVLGFASMLRIDTPEGVVCLGDVLNDFQRDFFAAISPALKQLAGHDVGDCCQRFYEERPRGHSKSGDLAVVITWLLVASRRKIYGIGAAADRDQARLLRDAVESLVRLNPILGEILDVQALKVVNKHTGSVFEIIPSDVSSSYGLTPHIIIADELCHWKSQDLWHSLLSAAAKRSDCIVACISNAGWKESDWWNLREAIRTDQDWRFARLDGPVASWISQSALAEQRRLLPDKVYRRLWLNEWADGSGDALELDDLDAAITLPCAPNASEKGYRYVAGLDLGLKRDASALVIIGKSVGYSEQVKARKRKRYGTNAALADLGFLEESKPETEYKNFPGDGRLKLMAVRVWRPQGTTVQIEDIEKSIIEINKMFPLDSVAFDVWQGEYLGQRLQNLGIRTDGVSFTSTSLQEMATATLDAFRERQLDLFPHESLQADLRALRITEKSYGYRLESPKGSTDGGTHHGDTVSALALALRAARRINVQSHLTCDTQLVLFGG